MPKNINPSGMTFCHVRVVIPKNAGSFDWAGLPLLAAAWIGFIRSGVTCIGQWAGRDELYWQHRVGLWSPDRDGCAKVCVHGLNRTWVVVGGPLRHGARRLYASGTLLKSVSVIAIAYRVVCTGAARWQFCACKHHNQLRSLRLQVAQKTLCKKQKQLP